jgi:hypothetical protein
MTVTHEPPRLNGPGPLHVRTLTHEKGPNADVGGSRTVHGDPCYGAG